MSFGYCIREAWKYPLLAGPPLDVRLARLVNRKAYYLQLDITLGWTALVDQFMQLSDSADQYLIWLENVKRFLSA